MRNDTQLLQHHLLPQLNLLVDRWAPFFRLLGIEQLHGLFPTSWDRLLQSNQTLIDLLSPPSLDDAMVRLTTQGS